MTKEMLSPFVIAIACGGLAFVFYWLYRWLRWPWLLGVSGIARFAFNLGLLGFAGMTVATISTISAFSQSRLMASASGFSVIAEAGQNDPSSPLQGTPT